MEIFCLQKQLEISPSRPNMVTSLSQVFYTYQDWIETNGSANAKEFLSSAFNEYLSTQGTVLQDITDYTPELNVTAERNICTVMKMMRSMLKGCRTAQESMG